MSVCVLHEHLHHRVLSLTQVKAWVNTMLAYGFVSAPSWHTYFQDKHVHMACETAQVTPVYIVRRHSRSPSFVHFVYRGTVSLA